MAILADIFMEVKMRKKFEIGFVKFKGEKMDLDAYQKAIIKFDLKKILSLRIKLILLFWTKF
ncbi:hypothetical protein ICE98_03403 [Lactococcus lactis]|nr:hypothetical protein [Lactococcus lactis]